jgi:hypothetical protein
MDNDCLNNPLQATFNSFDRSLLRVRKSIASNILLHVAQPQLQYYWLRAVCRCYNTMPLTGSNAMMQALRADTALSQQESKCWSSKLNKALQELLSHNDTTAGAHTS